MRSWKFRQHYPDGVLSIAVWCDECQAETAHRVEGNKLTTVCIPCQEKAKAEHERGAKPVAFKQGDLGLSTFMDWETGKVRA
jgi:hypothetical protein